MRRAVQVIAEAMADMRLGTGVLDSSRARLSLDKRLFASRLPLY